MFEEYGDIIKIEDICQMLGISRMAAINLTKENLCYCRIGRLYRIKKNSVIDYVESQGGVKAACQERS